MSASPVNRSSDILFQRCDLILRKPQNERSVLAELTGSVHPIINKTRMFGYLSSSPCFAHSIRFPGSGKFGVRYFQKFCHYFNSKRVRTVLVSPVAKPVAFLLNYEGCHASPRQTNKCKAKISAPALLCSLNLELISSSK